MCVDLSTILVGSGVLPYVLCQEINGVNPLDSALPKKISMEWLPGTEWKWVGEAQCSSQRQREKMRGKKKEWKNAWERRKSEKKWEKSRNSEIKWESENELESERQWSESRNEKSQRER